MELHQDVASHKDGIEADANVDGQDDEAKVWKLLKMLKIRRKSLVIWMSPMVRRRMEVATMMVQRSKRT